LFMQRYNLTVILISTNEVRRVLVRKYFFWGQAPSSKKFLGMLL
jgi:hypothetical protein